MVYIFEDIDIDIAVIIIQPMVKLCINTIHNYLCFISRDISSGQKKQPPHVGTSGQNWPALSPACLHSQTHLKLTVQP